jgi:hypothetical protein
MTEIKTSFGIMHIPKDVRKKQIEKMSGFIRRQVMWFSPQVSYFFHEIL